MNFDVFWSSSQLGMFPPSAVSWIAHVLFPLVLFSVTKCSLPWRALTYGDPGGRLLLVSICNSPS